MPRVLRATVRLERASGVAKDASVNVWHFGVDPTGGGITNADAQHASEALVDFYVNISQYLSTALSRAGTVHSISWADVTTGAAGADNDSVSPIFHTHFFNLGPSGGSTSYPSEVAICLSYRGATFGVPEEGDFNRRPRSSHRGRIYLGPIDTFAGTSSAQQPARITTACRDQIVVAYGSLMDGLEPDAGEALLTHGVYSPTTDRFWGTDHIHIDDAFDTVRSRGEVATSRTDATIVQMQSFNTDVPATP